VLTHRDKGFMQQVDLTVIEPADFKATGAQRGTRQILHTTMSARQCRGRVEGRARPGSSPADTSAVPSASWTSILPATSRSDMKSNAVRK
jgi:hypothetical protein